MKSSATMSPRHVAVVGLAVTLSLIALGASITASGQDPTPASLNPLAQANAPAATEAKENNEPTHEAHGACFDLKRRSHREQAIEAALDARGESWDIIDSPLADALKFIADRFDIAVQIDQRAMDDLGIDVNTQVTLDETDLSLRSALGLILEQLDLTYMIRHEVLLITTRERADNYTETRAYDLRRLPNYPSETLARIIPQAVFPETWTEQGGLGVAQALADTLVISQSQEVHRAVNDLLLQLERCGSK